MIPTEVFGVMFSKRKSSSYLLVKARATEKPLLRTITPRPVQLVA